MVARGDLGDIRVVQVEYPLEWMATGIELEGQHSKRLGARTRRGTAAAAR